MLLSVCSPQQASLWIFGEPYIRGTSSRVGYKYQYWSFVIFPSFSSVFNILISSAAINRDKGNYELPHVYDDVIQQH